MDKSPEEIEAIYAEFKALGEAKVRLYLATKKFGEASGKKALAPMWLNEQENNKTPWHKTWWGKAATAVGIIVLGAVLISLLGL